MSDPSNPFVTTENAERVAEMVDKLRLAAKFGAGITASGDPDSLKQWADNLETMAKRLDVYESRELARQYLRNKRALDPFGWVLGLCRWQIARLKDRFVQPVAPRPVLTTPPPAPRKK